MSKPIDKMTKEELIYALSDILERETDDRGSCRWCGAEEYPVDLTGEKVNPEDADEYHIDHRPDCAVTYIEAVLSGSYECALRLAHTREQPGAGDVRRG